ncbi:MAG: hypothetical protein AB7O59_04285 [Pirellulales bacterium]
MDEPFDSQAAVAHRGYANCIPDAYMIHSNQHRLNYPIYVIASARGLLFANVASDDCLLVFQTGEAASKIRTLFVDSCQDLGVPLREELRPVQILNAAELNERLKGQSRREVKCAVWIPEPGEFWRSSIDELLTILATE